VERRKRPGNDFRADSACGEVVSVSWFGRPIVAVALKSDQTFR